MNIAVIIPTAQHTLTPVTPPNEGARSKSIPTFSIPCWSAGKSPLGVTGMYKATQRQSTKFEPTSKNCATLPISFLFPKDIRILNAALHLSIPDIFKQRQHEIQ